MQNNLGLFLTKRAFMTPDREGYVDGSGGGRYTFRELNQRCNQMANALLAAGVQKEERVGLLLMNSVEFMESYFALSKIGAVIVPLNWRLVPDELEFILKDSGTRRLVYGDEFVDTVAELHSRGERTDISQWIQVGPSEAAFFADDYDVFRSSGGVSEPAPRGADDDMLYIMYTSGTTGLPKGVVHSHNTAIWALITIAASTSFADGEIYLAPLPMFHVGALTPLATNVYAGATSVVMRSFDPVRAWQLIQEEKVTTGLAVPAMLNFMLQVPNPGQYDHSRLKWMMTGAAPVPISLLEAYRKIGIDVLQIYGLTETCGPACLMDPAHTLSKPGSTGQAFFHTDVRIVNEAGADCAPDEAGEVLVRGPHIMREYWNQPQATAETIVDGWLHTGDVATMDAAGYVTIADRIKDMIISGGENVYPAEIEEVLMTHPGIVEAAVIGQPSEKWGESPFAILVKRDATLTEGEVLKYCQGKLANFKLPKAATFIEVIPRNPSGKILKRVLREQYPGPAQV